MKVSISTATGILLIAAFSVSGGPPMPDNPRVPTPPALFPTVQVAPHVAPVALPDPAGPMTLARMKTFVVSNPIRQAMIRDISLRSGTVTGTVDYGVPLETNFGSHHFQAATFTEGFGTTTNLTNDHTYDTEPTTTSILKGSVMHTAIVGTRWPDGTHAHLYSYHSTSLPSFDGPHDLPLPAGYTQEGDPYLAENAYSTGLFPGRMYCVGVLFSDRTGSSASAIAVWHSDDSGISWVNPPAIVATTNGGGHALDKPNITVSGFGGTPGKPTTRGHVFVTWIDVNFNNATGSSINVARSTDGGGSFTAPTFLSFQYVHFPQIVVNPADGTVYAIWANLNYHELITSQSVDNGSSFGSQDVVCGLNILNKDTVINGGIVVNSIPAARYDWAANRLVLVYTGSDGSGTGVYYTFKPGCTQCNFYGWQEPIQIPVDYTNDQFMPAIDFTLSGDVIISYYNRKDDSQNLLYREYVSHMTAGGSRLYESQASGAPASNPTGRSIGDYQDLWTDNYFDGQAASISWIALPQPLVTDLYLTRFFPY